MSNTQNNAQTHQFETEITQLLDLMIHSLYSEKEIFLRELISNASDAIDKRRFAALTDAALLPDAEEMKVRISVNKEAGTLTIADTGIGMSQDEVIANIGTIARSGTKHFMNALKEKQEAKEDGNEAINLIGQFGVGFYSVFMVADSVTLTTRKAGEGEATQWVSQGKGEYTLETTSKDDIGTSIVLTLKEDEKDYLESFRLNHVIKKYSDHISLPVEVETTTKDEDDNETTTWEQANTGTALWSRSKSDIDQEEYDNFYQTISYDQEAPVSTLHHRVEGKVEYTSLLYIPKKAPFDLFQRDSKRGLKLYVRRVFIMDDAENLLPNYLRFVKGVVDSSDLPLNVSREILQNNRDIEKIKSGVVQRILKELARLQKSDADTYADLWKEFGQVLKEGVVEDMANKDKISALLQFASTSNAEADDAEAQNVSFSSYIERMSEEQDAIYYITAESHKAAAGSPHLEVFNKKGIEVLLLSDPVDEWLINSLPEFDGKPLKSITKGDLELDEEEKAEQEEQAKSFSDITDKLKEALEAKVKDVRITNRLTDSPACLVADENDMGANLERIMKSMGQEAPVSKPILEINPEHALVKKLDIEKADFADWAHVLFDQAALSEGANLVDPAEYVKRVNKLLAS